MPTAARSRALLRPVAPFERPAVRLVLVSASILLAELTFIRWTQDRLLYLGFFSNFVLIVSFLGIGLGILLGRGRDARRASPFGGLLFALVAVVLWAEPPVVRLAADSVFFGTGPEQLRHAVVVAAVLVLVTAALAALALPLGDLLRSMAPLRAYALDIAGALAGIAAFVLFALLWAPPAVWLGALALVLLALRLGAGLTAWSVAAGVLVTASMVLVHDDHARGGGVWSPYRRVAVHTGPVERVVIGGEPRRYGHDLDVVAVGGILNESLWHTDLVRGSFYDEPYRLLAGRALDRVLVIGAGGGTDAAFALDAGARRVDAVEIDPAIVALAGPRHPDRPYADPRVAVHVEDGRAFLRRTAERYDLVVLAQVGSRSEVAARSNLRLESYLLTEEAFVAVRDHLAPDGVFAIYYIKDERAAWRYAVMLDRVFGAPAVAHVREEDFGRGYVILAGPGAAPLAADAASRGLTVMRPPPGLEPATDDWPFPYLPGRAVPTEFAVALALLLLSALAAVAVTLRRSARSPGGRFSPHFFLLGAAFLLLETRSIAVFSLLFGTTWLVNALVFFAILTSVLASILVSARVRLPRPALYAALFAALAANVALPPEALLLDPPWLRYTAAAVLAFAPVFCANLVFTAAFARTRSADVAFASNLLGAVVGGVLEWTALLVGFRALVIVVAVLYAVAYLAAARVRLSLDRELAPAAAR